MADVPKEYPLAVVNQCRGQFRVLAEPAVNLTEVELLGTIHVGFGSYMRQGLVRSHCVIGRYCSIGRGVSIGSGHTDLLSTSTSSWFPEPTTSTLPLASRDPKIRTLIGHDVWIGDAAKILSGVTIGTGAVIGTSAVVTKDVEPYSILVGIPAKKLRYRFSPEIIEKLLDSKWWTYEPGFLKSIYDHDPVEMLKALELQSATLPPC